MRCLPTHCSLENKGRKVPNLQFCRSAQKAEKSKIAKWDRATAAQTFEGAAGRLSNGWRTIHCDADTRPRLSTVAERERAGRGRSENALETGIVITAAVDGDLGIGTAVDLNLLTGSRVRARAIYLQVVGGRGPVDDCAGTAV